MSAKKSLVFFGNEKLATGIAETKPVILKALEAAGFKIEQHVTGNLSELGAHDSKIAVLAAYGHIIPQRVIDEFPLGIINVHPSLLPRYRGSAPIETAILDGVKKTGVSIMCLTAGMDEGPIYRQKTVHLTGTETKQELTEMLQQLGADLLVEVIPTILDGSIKPRKQPHVARDVSYTKRIQKEDGAIDWTKPAQTIEREIRAYAGWPKSYAQIAGKDVIITEASVVKDSSAAPGKAWKSDKGLMIGTAEGYLNIQMLKPAGKKEMTAAEFIRGYGQGLH